MRHALAMITAMVVSACGGGSQPGDDGGDDDQPPPTVMGCDGATLLANPVDPAEAGPWPVGARTITIGRLTVEVWYPAQPGSEAGAAPVRYDIRQALNPSQRAIVSDADNPWQPCDCFRDLPLDAAHGPYPIVAFVHGTAGFRHQSVTQMQHWASRGLVVIAADHPGLMLGDLLATACPDEPSGSQNLSADLDAMIAALAAPTADLAFLAGELDVTRIAIAGHSAGANAAAAAAGKPGVRVVVSLAGAMAAQGASLERVVFMGGADDGIINLDQVTTAWSGSATPRHLIGIERAGHLAFSDLCETRNAAGQNLLEVATAYGLCGADFAGFLFDCDPAHLDGPTGWAITNYATSAALESALQCSTTAPAVGEVEAAYPEVETYMEAL